MSLRRLCTAAVACALVAGCASLPSASSILSSPSSQLTIVGELHASVQWREPAGSSVRVAEVFLENQSTHDVSIESITLGDKPLKLPSGTPRKGVKGPLWWSIRPSATIPQGGSALATIAFEEGPREASPLLCVASGHTNSISIPRFAFPYHLINAIVFPAGDIVAVQTASGTVSPVSLSVNGHERAFLRLKDGRRGLPDLLVASLPKPVRTGDDVFIRVAFADGTARRALVKALASATVDVLGADEAARRSIGIRSRAEVTGLPPEDVGCYDLESRRTGASIPALLANRAKVPLEDSRLRAVHFCTGAVSSTFDLYGAIADAAFSSSFTFEQTESPDARIAIAERDFLRVSKAVRPRPAIWYAGLFRRGGKVFTSDEADAIFWSMLALGSRGVRVYVWREKHGIDGLEALPELAGHVRRWVSVIERRGRDLAALVPVEASSSGRFIIRTAWNPLSGMLVSWRTNDLSPACSNASLRIRRPEWLQPRSAENLATGRRANYSVDGGDLIFELDSEASSGAFWILARRHDIPGGKQ